MKLDDGFKTQPARVRVTGGDGTFKGTIELIITEGHNREVRRMCDAVGLTVPRLKRTAIGPLQLGKMKAGEYRQLKPSEIAGLRRNASAGKK